MKIPVSRIEGFRGDFDYLYWDSDMNRFDTMHPEREAWKNRNLPLSPFFQPVTKVQKQYFATIIGRIPSRNQYVLCLGDRIAYAIDRAELGRYRLTNAIVENNHLRVFDNVQDMTVFYPDKNIKFISVDTSTTSASAGVQQKFLGSYAGRKAVVKLFSGTFLIDNEVIVYNIAKYLGISCKNLI